MMCLLGGLSSSLMAQDVTIGSIGSNTSNQNLPFRLRANTTTANYTGISQQIYTYDEIYKANYNNAPEEYISKLAFYATRTSVSSDKNITIYMKTTDEETVTAWDKDFSEANIVYSGNATIDEDGKMEFVIKPFKHKNKNVIIFVDANRNSVSSSYSETYFLTKSITTKSAYKATSTITANYGLDGTWPTVSTLSVKNVITFTFSSSGSDDTSVTPTAVTNVSPSNNASYGSNPQELTWTFGANTAQYQVLVGTEKEDGENGRVINTLGQQDFVEKGEGDNGSYSAEGLSAGTKYYWQVISKNENGETAGDVWNFTTVNAEPTAMVTKTYPENGASLKTSDVVLKWSYGNDEHARYTIYLGESADEMEVLFTDTDDKTEYTPNNLQGEKTYYWRVDVNNAIYTSEDINVWSFTTKSVGNISGIVKFKDAEYNDVAVDGASITIYDKEGNKIDETTTDNNGGYEFTGIIVGDYDLVVEKNGYETYTVEVTVEGNETMSFDIYMPSVIKENGTWNTLNALSTEFNELIVKANAVLQSTAKVGSLTIEDGQSVTIKNGAVLTVVGEINNNGEIIIEDGGQIYQSNPNIEAIFKMNINNPDDWENDNTGEWQFISSPFTNALVSDFTDDIEGEYDLYKYNGTQKDAEWDNQKNDEEFEKEFVSGRGYLASYQIEETAEIRGILNSSTIFSLDNIYFTYENHYANYHLLGNPFPFDMDWSKLDDYTYNVVNGYAVLLEDGSYDYKKDGIIKAGDGFFIRTIGKSASIYYDHNKTSKNRGQSSYIDVIASGKAGKDNVIVNFAGKAEGFNKLQNFNDAIATVYVSENGKHYGIANVDENTTEVALNFNAKEMGNYSISLDVNGEFETVTLVDRFTGVETNMLLEDEYTFTATSNDSHNRFVVRLAQGSQLEAQSQFVYQSGEELILSIEGHVQIVDMLGRVVYSNEHANGDNRISVSEFNNAAYVVRVINEEGVKTQKVVIY